MKLRFIPVVVLALLPMVVGAGSSPKTLAPVGPESAGCCCEATGENGFLQVFSATQKSVPVASDDPWVFDLHTGYDILDAAGQLLKFVPNHASNMDVTPDQVALPAGEYQVVAESGQFGRVTVPVMIENGKATVVRLE